MQPGPGQQQTGHPGYLSHVLQVHAHAAIALSGQVDKQLYSKDNTLVHTLQ
jgi:hypothetical protein